MPLSSLSSSEDVDIIAAITGRGHPLKSRPFPGDDKDAKRNNAAFQLFCILAAEEGHTNPRCAILTFEKLDKEFPESITRHFTNADFAYRRERKDSLSVYEFTNAISGDSDDLHNLAEVDVSDAKLADASSAQRARGKAQSSHNNPSSNSSQGKGHRQKSSSYATMIDIFVTLVQKVGIWIYNILPQISVSLPVFTISMSWLEFPAIGWELALNLPDLEKRGWLYWIVLIGGWMFPMYIAYVIFTDKGILKLNKEVSVHYNRAITMVDDPEADNNKVPSENDYVERNSDEDDYKDQLRNHALVNGSILISNGVAFIGIGSGTNNGEVIGFGVLLLLGGFLYYGWERLKLYVLEMELAKYNRVIHPAYRGMRVFVCSTAMLLLLRSTYIMTISALCLTIMESIGKDDRIIELVVSSLLVGPITVAFPLVVFLNGREFYQKYIEPLPAEEKDDPNKFRGWLERFSMREGDASMLEATIATLLLPYLPQYWYFSYLQLIERAAATIFVTCLYREVTTQLILALCIEFLAGLHEFIRRPFTDYEEDFYNILWRSIAFSMLLVILLVKAIGDPFSTAGDILLLLLSIIALMLFIIAIDIPRIIRAYRRSQAVKQFRDKPILNHSDSQINPLLNKHYEPSSGVNHKGSDLENIGDIGLLAPLSNMVDIAPTLRNAIEDIPSDIPPSVIIRDSLNYIQQYRLLAKCDDSEDLHDIVLSNDLFWRVEPLLSLTGSRLGEAIPQSIGAYANVTRLILSDMNLDDQCSVKWLIALRKLEYLNLDGNLFRTQIDGLCTLTQVKKLYVRRLMEWDGTGTLMLTKDISMMTSLKVLDMNDSKFASGGISKEFVDKLFKLDEYTGMGGRTLKAKDCLFPHAGFSIDQYHEGGVSVTELKRAGVSAEDLKTVGYIIQDLKSEFSYAELISAKFTEDELKSHGVFPLPELKEEIKSIMAKLNNGEEYDSKRLDYLLECLSRNPTYIAEQEEAHRLWREKIKVFCEHALDTMIAFVPPHISTSTVEDLIQEGYSKSLSERLHTKRYLWLLRRSKEDISKMHVVDLCGLYSVQDANLDIIELAAVYWWLPSTFLYDDSGRKEQYRKAIEMKLKEMYQDKENGNLVGAKLRNAVYRNVTPLHGHRESVYVDT
jgi:hypothetical protein